MSKPIVPPETIRELLDYDPDAGSLVWRLRPRELFTSNRSWSRWNNRYAGVPAGSLNKGRMSVLIFGLKYKLHRVAFAHFHGRWPTGQIDHINGNPADNRVRNLRDVTRRENAQNQKRAHSSNKSSGLLGVSWSKPSAKWMARIFALGESHYIGLFDCKHDAHKAYLRAKADFHEGYVQ